SRSGSADTFLAGKWRAAESGGRWTGESARLYFSGHELPARTLALHFDTTFHAPNGDFDTSVSVNGSLLQRLTISPNATFPQWMILPRGTVKAGEPLEIRFD